MSDLFPKGSTRQDRAKILRAGVEKYRKEREEFLEEPFSYQEALQELINIGLRELRNYGEDL